MAAMQKVEEFDMEGLKEYKKSLICGHCKRPPRPNTQFHRCVAGTKSCEKICCSSCKVFKDICHGTPLKFDAKLTKFVGLFKFYNCQYMKNGCQKELVAINLSDHEEICLFRDVACPKIDCNAEFVFNGIMDHYQRTHTDFKVKDDVLEFKGSREDLKKSVFILNCYGKPFFPQFFFNKKMENFLHFWVVGHGDQAEMNSFEMSVDFFLDGKPRISMKDYVRGLHDHYRGQPMMINEYHVTQYFDVESKEIKDQEFIELEMKIVNEKLDEIEKDLNESSGIEDN